MSEQREIIISVKPNRKRTGKRLYEASYPWKGYAAEGRTRAEALGALLLDTPVAGYLEIDLRRLG